MCSLHTTNNKTHRGLWGYYSFKQILDCILAIYFVCSIKQMYWMRYMVQIWLYTATPVALMYTTLDQLPVLHRKREVPAQQLWVSQLEKLVSSHQLKHRPANAPQFVYFGNQIDCIINKAILWEGYSCTPVQKQCSAFFCWKRTCSEMMNEYKVQFRCIPSFCPHAH